LAKAKPLQENAGVSFEGTTKYGDFDIPGEQARQWLKLPNPHNRPNCEVIKPWANGMDITRRSFDTWIIDFGTTMSEVDASLYEIPFHHLHKHVRPEREKVRRERTRRNWWIHKEAHVSMRAGLAGLSRFIVTPRVAKHRLFVWLNAGVLPDTRLNIIARSDDTTFGILHSRLHELWSLGTCSWHGVGNDPTYNAKSCFKTFPFPVGLSPADTAPKSEAEKQALGYTDGDGATANPFAAPVPSVIADPARRLAALAIVEAAFRLNRLRENWLNPSEWVEWVITPEEAQAGFPKRPVARAGHEAELKKRTLTNLYNAQPAWLVNAHQALDKAVAAAYGWNDYTPDMSNPEILQRLLQLNLVR
jgi:type II restriction/modification system DNA methylase subunit YeeA